MSRLHLAKTKTNTRRSSEDIVTREGGHCPWGIIELDSSLTHLLLLGLDSLTFSRAGTVFLALFRRSLGSLVGVFTV
jgi:hypothetical protein